MARYLISFPSAATVVPDGEWESLVARARVEAPAWAARIARACRCNQKFGVFGFDPQS
jgi:hypothetical protein